MAKIREVPFTTHAVIVPMCPKQIDTKQFADRSSQAGNISRNVNISTIENFPETIENTLVSVKFKLILSAFAIP